jgi:hypothetical protein|tara:strand:- start:295 stop:663 length:369 start_codon:yes stop_codon:yes gene_type:complete
MTNKIKNKEECRTRVSKTMLTKSIYDLPVEVRHRLKEKIIINEGNPCLIKIKDDKGGRESYYHTNIRFYKTKRGDSRFNIKEFKTIASEGDYIQWNISDISSKLITLILIKPETGNLPYKPY